MFFYKKDELIIQGNEYIVLNKCNEDGKEYLFVADRMHPDINLIDNFDEEALKLLLLSKEEDVETNTYKVEKDQDIIQKIVIDMYA